MLRTQVRPQSAAAQSVRARPVQEERAAPAAPVAASPPPDDQTEHGTADVEPEGSGAGVEDGEANGAGGEHAAQSENREEEQNPEEATTGAADAS